MRVRESNSRNRFGGLFIRRSLRFQLLFLFGIITVGSQIVLLITAYSSSFSVATDQARSVAQAELHEANMRIDKLMYTIEHEALLFAQNIAVQSVLRRQKDTKRIKDYDDYRLLSLSVLAAEHSGDVWNVRLFPNSTRRFFFDSETVFFDTGELEEAGLLEGHTGELSWWTIPYYYELTGGSPRLIVSYIRRIQNNVDLGNLLGLVVFDITVDYISDHVSLANVLPSASVVLRDFDGNQIVHLAGEYSRKPDTTSPVFNLTEQNHVYEIAASVYLAPYSKHSLQIVRRLLFVGILIMLGTAGVVIVLSETITRRLRLVSTAMETIEQKDFRLKIEVRGQDEVAHMAMHFNSMADRIRRLIDDVYKTRLKSTLAEMRMLRAQINPHFLYNALDGISWMATRRGAPDVVTAVEDLSHFLRLSLSRVQEKSTVAEEVEHARAYFTIQQFRFEDRISLSVSIPPSIGQLSTIPLILQPLIENAVVHGILAEAGRTGLVSIQAELFENSVFLRVSDNGVGIGPDRMREVQESLYGDEEPPETNGHGLGLANIARRIRYNYGPDFGVDLHSELNAGTSVTISFPCTS